MIEKEVTSECSKSATEDRVESVTLDAQSKRRIGPVTFEVTDQQGAIAQMLIAIRAHSCDIFAFCNMHTFNLARRLPSFAATLAKARIFNDGIGMDLASVILFGAPFPDNLNGTDLTPALLMSLERPTSIFLVGGRPGVAEQAARALENAFEPISVVGWQHGYFSQSEGEEIADHIRCTQADLILIGMGNPRQELWAVEMAERIGGVIICVGAFLDFTAGRISRAPRFIRSMRCEWLYRLALEPARLTRRYIGGAMPFFWAILVERLRRLRSGAAGGSFVGRQEEAS